MYRGKERMTMHGAYHSVGLVLFLPTICIMAGCQENGAVKQQEVDLLSEGIDEDGNLFMHFELDSRYQGDLYAEVSVQGDEISIALCTHSTPGASRKIPYADGYRLVVPWPEGTDSVDVSLCGMKLGGWEKKRE